MRTMSGIALHHSKLTQDQFGKFVGLTQSLDKSWQPVPSIEQSQFGKKSWMEAVLGPHLLLQRLLLHLNHQMQEHRRLLQGLLLGLEEHF